MLCSLFGHYYSYLENQGEVNWMYIQPAIYPVFFSPQ